MHSCIIGILSGGRVIQITRASYKKVGQTWTTIRTRLVESETIIPIGITIRYYGLRLNRSLYFDFERVNDTI